MLRRTVVEVAVQDVSGARAAIDAGAGRLELCQALSVGGVTPSLGLIEGVLEVVDPAAVNVLVRPRGGGFVYDRDEVAVVAADIRLCVERGVGGVVIGALTPSGDIDTRALKIWQEAAAGCDVVFHRAIDAAADPVAALSIVKQLGIRRVLSSGGAERSIEGIAVLAEMVARRGEVEIMAGGGVRPRDIPALMGIGVDAVHLSAKAVAGLGASSGPGGGSAGHDVTDARIVAAAVAAAGAGTLKR